MVKLLSTEYYGTVAIISVLGGADFEFRP